MRRATPGRLALSLLGGVLMAISFPLGSPLPVSLPEGWWPAGWLCLAPLMLAAGRASSPTTAAGLGLAFGMAAFGPILAWIGPFLVRWGRLSVGEAAGVAGLLTFYLALYPAVFASCLHLWRRRWGQRGLALAPACWAALELARGRLLTGFPWCLLGYSQPTESLVSQVADVAGVYGVSFTLACASAVLAWTVDAAMGGTRIDGVRLRTGPMAFLALIACVVMALGYGLWRSGALPAAGPSLPVALVQANVAQADKWDPEERERIEARHVSMTTEAASRGARLVVWSESSVPVSLTHHPDYVGRLEALAARTRAELVVGTVVYERRGGIVAPLNSAVLVRPDAGIADRYDKIHLVPFGEYVPLKRLLPFLEPLVQEASDFQPGEVSRPLMSGAGPLGALICYEAIFPELARGSVVRGASILVNITNDAWYGETAMPRQHLRQAALRAVETRRWLLRCANTGISAIVAPDGSIVARAELDREEILSSVIASASGATIYTTVGEAFGFACAILALAAVGLSARPAPAGERHVP